MNATGGSKTAVVHVSCYREAWCEAQASLLSYFQTEAKHGNNLLPTIFRMGATLPITAVVEKETLVYDGLILKWLSVSSQALITGDSCTFIFLTSLDMTDMLSC